jgi:hypothetical protein
MLMGWHEAEFRIRRGDWADTAGNELRKVNPKAFSASEVKFKKEFSEFLGTMTQYDYSSMGMPSLFDSNTGKIAFGLTSFPMNYYHKTIVPMVKIGFKGTFDLPSFKNIKAPVTMRFAAAKHVLGMAFVVAAAREAGVNFESIAPVSYDPEKKSLGGIDVGIFEMRPSPAISLFNSLVTAVSNDNPYIRSMAMSNLKWGGVFVPGKLAAKDIKQAIDEGDQKAFLFYKKKEPKPKSFSPFGNPFPKSEMFK